MHQMWRGNTYVAPAKRGREQAIGASGPRRTTESIMDPRRNQEQIGLFTSFNPAATSEIDAIRAAAVRARDEALAKALRSAFTRIGQALGSVGQALLNWPERRRTYESLRSLTDRELADIGLTRGDIARVFEPEFRAPAKTPANANAPVPGGARPRAA
ncbi:DUF1127 domain-containing protein [Falsiroseomonas sp. CW058]|uniref:DUF1127 domain-containing protein n=1 Tax=Falsiroseomonas sp. CW058 TaxID=3388664 RepID=UPI003D31D1CD